MVEVHFKVQSVRSVFCALVFLCLSCRDAGPARTVSTVKPQQERTSSSCIFSTKNSGHYEEHNDCFTTKNGWPVTMRSSVLAKVDFADKPYAEFGGGPGGWGYVHSSGKVMYTKINDNMALAFSAGYTVYETHDGKFGIMNENLEVVLPPGNWDDLGVPEYGVAIFCHGCKRHHDNCGHHKTEGGMWGFVTLDGVETFPPGGCGDWRCVEAYLDRQPDTIKNPSVR